jgi:hypothetical protein
MGGGLTGMIGQNKPLQDELKMDKEQVDKLTKALAQVREELKDEMAQLFDFNTPQEERDKITKQIRDANEKALSSALKPEQVKRLRQIENQQARLGLFNRADVQKTLKLTDEQKEKIKTINDDLQKDMRELFAGGRGGPGGFGGFNPEAMKQQQGLQKEAMNSVVKILDEEQKATLKDLTGAPFELRFEGFGMGGPGGFGAGGPGGRGPGGAGGFGRGGMGGFGGFGQPGQILSTFLQDSLKLSPEQKKKLEEVQKDIDAKLGKILTDEQKKQLKDMQSGFGRGGFGPGGFGPGGRGPGGGRRGGGAGRPGGPGGNNPPE